MISSSDPYYDQHVLIDREVAKLRAQISQLCIQKNTLIPACRLPPEMLCNIFLWTRDSPQGRRNFSIHSWIPLTQVCHHWRNAALSCPQLWSNIAINNDRQGLCFFSRSKQAPINVLVDGHTQLVPETIAQHQRIRSLSLSGRCPPAVSRQVLMGLCGIALPILQYLDISNPNGSTGSSTNVDETTLPFDFLASGAPQLREIRLYRQTFSWGSPFFSQRCPVEVLELDLSDVSLYFPSGADEFFNALNNMKTLTELRIRTASNNLTVESFQRDQPVVLQHMEKLDFTMPPATCITLLKNLVLPPSVQLELNVDSPSSAVGLGANLAHAITSAWLSGPPFVNGPSGKPYICALSFNTNGGETNLTAWLGDQQFPINEQDFDFQSISRLTIETNQTPQLVEELLMSIPLHSLHSLFLEAWLEDPVWDTIANLPNLQSITLGWQSAPLFIAHIGHSEHDFRSFIDNNPKATITTPITSSLTNEQEALTPTKYPKLVTIKLLGVFFGPDPASDRYYRNIRDSEYMHHDAFPHFLQWRQTLGLPIQTLSLSLCRGLRLEDVNKTLPQLVVDFQWDKQGIGY